VSFVDDIAAAVDAFGVQAAGVVYGIGLTPWKSDEERDGFLKTVTSGVTNG
jgi:hypothetical protein